MQKKTFTLLLLPLAVIIVLGLLSLIGIIFQTSFAKADELSVLSLAPHSQRNAFSKASKQVENSQKMDFLIGRAMFKKLWVSAPASTKSSDGLGPLYNARSCLSCHPKNGRGRPTEKDKISQSLFLQLSIAAPTQKDVQAMREGKKEHTPEPHYGGQLQNRAVQAHEPEAEVRVSYTPETVTLKGGEQVILRRPIYHITGWHYGAAHKDMQYSPRLAPQMIGLGLLEGISAAHILKNADPNDKNQDGISGKASKVWSFVKKKVMLGRFGWKASTPSVLEQSSRALNSDIGISNPIFTAAAGDCTKAQKSCQQAPNGNGNTLIDNDRAKDKFEINKGLNGKLAFYAAHLAVPKQRQQPKKKIALGEALFRTIGCSECHIASFESGTSNQEIWPYSDLLLHDMGKGLADNRPVYNASGTEWRTAPLWGIGLSEAVNGNGYFLHDGRARSIKEAILWHGGEAKNAVTPQLLFRTCQIGNFLDQCPYD